MESLTPEVRAMCALLKADTAEDFDRRLTEYQATVTKAVKTLVDEAEGKIAAAVESFDSVKQDLRADIGELRLEIDRLVCPDPTTPDHDELAPAYFFDDTAYVEWAETLAATERDDEVPAPSDDFHEPEVETSSPTSALAVSTTGWAAASVLAATAADISTPPTTFAPSGSGGIASLLASPTTCSSLCPGGDTSTVVSNVVANVFATPIPSTCSMLVRDLDTGNTRVTTVATLTQGMPPALPVPAEDTTCDRLFRFHVLGQRPQPWPSFECSRIWSLSWSVHVRDKFSEFMCKIMEIKSGDDTRYGDINGWSGLNAIDGDHKAKSAACCVIIATYMEHDLDSECKILLGCCRSIPNDVLLDRVSITLLESVAQLVLSQVNFGGAVYMHATPVYCSWPHSSRYSRTCSLFTCLPRGDCQKHPWIPPQMISLMRRRCSELISMEEPSSCLPCLHLQLCCPPDRPKLSDMLLLFSEAQVDGKSLRYSICCGGETIQWAIAWTFRYDCDFLVQTERLQVYRLQICKLAWDEHLYELSGLNCWCEPWTFWQIHLFIPGTRIGSSLYAFLICLKAQTVCIQPDELEMRLELSMQIDLFAWNCCSIVPLNLGSCSSLQYYSQFESIPWDNQKMYRTEDYIGSVAVSCFSIGTIGNAFICDPHHFQWYIAWSLTHARFTVPTTHLSRPVISLMTTEVLASEYGMHFLLGGTLVHYFDIFQWEIAWAFELEGFDWSFQFGQPFPLAAVSAFLNIIYDGLRHYRLLTTWICDLITARDILCTTARNARQLIGASISSQQRPCYRSTAEIFSSNAHCVGAWHVLCARLRFTENFAVHQKARSKRHGDIFGELYLALFSVLLPDKKVQMSWDPGIGEIIDYGAFFAQVHAGQDLNLDAYLDLVHIGNNYYIGYIGIFLEQDGAICYLNLVKVCLDYGSHRNLSEVLKHQVQWDPGDSTWHRLEVVVRHEFGLWASRILRGGDCQRPAVYQTRAGRWAASCWALGPLQGHYIYKGTTRSNVAGNGSAASAWKARIG